VAADDRPTAKQLALLRHLAQERGQPFSYPRTRASASAEIKRLLETAHSLPGEHRRDREAVGREAREQLDAARVRPDEGTGYGASAQWRKGRER
jgi:hypothetical protein